VRCRSRERHQPDGLSGRCHAYGNDPYSVESRRLHYPTGHPAPNRVGGQAPGDAALERARGGLAVFPVLLFYDARAGKWQKLPLTDHGYKDATTDEATISKWWSRYPNAAIGAVPASQGCVVIDLDIGWQDCPETIEWLKGLGPTYTVRTVSGGEHRYYRTGEKFGNGKPVKHVDIRSANGFVVIPPSPGYMVIDSRDMAALPSEYVGRLSCASSEAGKAKHEGADDPLAVDRFAHWLTTEAPIAIEGQGGNNTTYQVACTGTRNFELSDGVVLALMIEHWNDRCQPPWDLDELARKVWNSGEYGQRNEPDWRGRYSAIPNSIEVATMDDGYIGTAPNEDRLYLDLENLVLIRDDTEGMRRVDEGRAIILAYSPAHEAEADQRAEWLNMLNGSGGNFEDNLTAVRWISRRGALARKGNRFAKAYAAPSKQAAKPALQYQDDDKTIPYVPGEGCTVLVIGPKGTHKTGLAMKKCLDVVERGGRVLYLAVEGSHGIETARLPAYVSDRNLPQWMIDERWVTVDVPFRILDATGIKDLVEAYRDFQPSVSGSHGFGDLAYGELHVQRADEDAIRVYVEKMKNGAAERSTHYEVRRSADGVPIIGSPTEPRASAVPARNSRLGDIATILWNNGKPRSLTTEDLAKNLLYLCDVCQPDTDVTLSAI
jgi:Bifunctional DNA primase/polymerase, N-terminal